MPSKHYRLLDKEIRALGTTYLNFTPRPAGNYTRRQLSAAAAYTVFCHAEFENFLEQWATEILEQAEAKWKLKQPTRPLVHLCTFHEARPAIDEVPKKDIWSESITQSINKQKNIINKNNGIKEVSVCRMLAPLGFDLRLIDSILIADLSAFGKLRGDYAHSSHAATIGSAFDPFSRKLKAESLRVALLPLDGELEKFLKSA